jgi:hypothetical protein
VLSYHTLPIDGSAAGSERDALPGQIRLDQPVGYDVQVAAPVGLGWTASARYQDLPVQPAYLGLRQGSASDTYYLSNGNVADRRASLLLERPGSFGTFSIRLTDGRAEGYVSDAILWASPYRILSERELRYRSAAAQLTFQKTGTGLVVEWVEMAERQPDSQGVPRHVNRYVDAEFQQDLIRFGFLDARCRLVVAARLGPGGASDGRHAERDLLALQRRLSAGVAVLF